MTPDNITPHWYEFMYDNQTGAIINGNTITLHFVDGLRGDDSIAGLCRKEGTREPQNAAPGPPKRRE